MATLSKVNDRERRFKSQIADLIGEGWAQLLWREFTRPYMKKIQAFLKKERQQHTVHPAKKDVFKALRLCPVEECKVVIIGQDPYPHDHADGLAFSCSSNRDLAPSLHNIFQELEDDIGFTGPAPDASLERWAKQGVLLLNTVLTVRDGDTRSHSHIGWQTFTRKIISLIGSEQAREKVFILWGNYAQSFLDDAPPAIDPFEHWCIQSSHPSPLSAYRSFFGSRPFSRTNEKLVKSGYDPVDWTSNNPVLHDTPQEPYRNPH
jgi:uracil-DNA glycosylase